MNAAGEFLSRLFTLKGAIASVSLSHEQDCDCTTCRAAHGDKEAFTEIAYSLQEERARGLDAMRTM